MTNINQSEIWYVNLDPTIGDEISKIRTCLVVSNDKIRRLKLKTIVPITGWSDKFKNAPWMIAINPNNQNNLNKKSSVDTFQVKSISNERFIKKLGSIDETLLKKVHETILKTFNPTYSIL